MFFRVIVSCILVLATYVYGQVSSGWFKTITTENNNDNIQAIVAGERCIYVAGYVDEDADFGGGAVIKDSIATGNWFIAKYYSDGRLAWLRTLCTSGTTVHFKRLVLDSRGDLYIYGNYSGTLCSDESKFHASNDIFLGKYLSDGTFAWLKHFGDFNTDIAGDIVIDADDNIYICGSYRRDIDFAGKPLFDGGGFLVGFDRSGYVLWTERFGGYGALNEAVGIGMDLDSSGNIYLSVNFKGSIDFFGQQFISSPLDVSDMIVAKLSADRRLLWTKHITGKGSLSNEFLGVDPHGYLYIAGSFENDNYFDSIQIHSIGSRDLFLARYGLDGEIDWVTTQGGVNGLGAETIMGLNIDPSSNVLMAGSFLYSTSIGSTVIESKGERDLYLVRYLPDGSVGATIVEGAHLSEWVDGIAADKEGTVYLIGGYGDTTIIDSSMLIHIDSTNMFIWKMAEWGRIGEIGGPKQYPPQIEVLSLVPNPVLDNVQLTIQAGIELTVQITLVDILGKTVGELFNGHIDPGIHPLALSTSYYPPGVYYVKLVHATGMTLTRLVIL